MSYINLRGARFGGHQSFSAGHPMTDDDLRRVAPSIFADAKHDSRSERYTYIPPTTFWPACGRKASSLPAPSRARHGSRGRRTTPNT